MTSYFICLGTSVFISMTLDGGTIFPSIKTYEIHVNASITVGALGGISFYIMAEIWKHLKNTLAF